MNFVRLYIGDYMRDTGTLTVAEHGAYMLMLMHYYATEKPIPDGRALHRLLRAETKAEREAIDNIAGRFWTATDGGLVNARATKEIKKHAFLEAQIAVLRAGESYRQHRSFVLGIHGEKCFYCGAVNERLQLDHVVPRSRGGSDDPSNLVPACKPCNTSKGAKLLAEWRPSYA